MASEGHPLLSLLPTQSELSTLSLSGFSHLQVKVQAPRLGTQVLS